jgi:glycosyltransferase 2 family protein
VQTPELANLTFSRAMLLMAASLGGSLLQLPIIGWFTQIAVTATAMHAFYGAPVEAATACGALLLAVTFLCIIPAGLLCAQIDHVSLKKVAEESEEAGKEAEAA